FGNAHVIRNLKIDRDTPAGLFGWATDAVIQDVGLVNVDVRSHSDTSVGALAGGVESYYSSSKIERVYSTGKITCAANQGGCINGGLIGYAYTVNDSTLTISDAWSSAAVIGSYYAGGLIGTAQLNTTVRNSYATGD